MRSDESQFWDERFKHEGTIWGDTPSATATTALRYVPANSRVLEIGFGYGRDLAFMLRQGYRMSGIDLSVEARHRTEARLQRAGLQAEQLLTGSFEESNHRDILFDGVLSHRMAHLLITDDAVERFVRTVKSVLRAGGLLCMAVRNSKDVNPSETRLVQGNVYEYLPRPGHWIRFWDDEDLRRAFGKCFDFLTLDHVCELESGARPVPCYLTVMVAQRSPAA
ncbi:MAG TPA: class I SAM-dependent methyltransferase [Gemmataceae bacterium]|jgi:SAM-dependent methyltransferase|nr:class I SAM-dependent methyltransferase [Gemmataceae bacterium]